MPRKRRSPHHNATRRTPRDHHRPPTFDVETQPLIHLLRDSLRDDDPVAFLVNGTNVAAMMLAMPEPETPGDVSLLQSFMEVDIAETTAVLHVAREFVEDELTRARIDRVLTQRRQPLPATVTDFGSVTVTHAWLMADPLGLGDNIIIGAEWPNGQRIAGVVYVDHTLGTIAKDAFFIGSSATEVIDRFRELAAHEPGAPAPVPFDLAPARARIDQAVTNFVESGYEPPDDDPETPSQWPQCAVLLRQLLLSMPEGGLGYDEEHECDPERISAAVTTFLESPEAQNLAGAPDDLEALTHELAHQAMHLTGDPLEWNQVSVEVCVTGELPFDATLTETQLDLVPTVLPAVVRYAHREAGTPPDETAEVLDTIARVLPEFASVREMTYTNRERSREIQGLLTGTSRDRAEHAVRRAAGSLEFDLEPLPDEDLVLDDAPGDLHDLLVEISAHVDRLVASEAFADLGMEFRTAVRRFLVRAAAADPALFRRRAKAVNTAATATWMVGRANQVVGYSPAPVRSSDLQAWFGVSAFNSERGERMVDAFRSNEPEVYIFGVDLGSADVLVSRYRQELRQMLEDAGASED